MTDVQTAHSKGVSQQSLMQSAFSTNSTQQFYMFVLLFILENSFPGES